MQLNEVPHRPFRNRKTLDFEWPWNAIFTRDSILAIVEASMIYLCVFRTYVKTMQARIMKPWRLAPRQIQLMKLLKLIWLEYGMNF